MGHSYLSLEWRVSRSKLGFSKARDAPRLNLMPRGALQCYVDCITFYTPPQAIFTSKQNRMSTPREFWERNKNTNKTLLCPSYFITFCRRLLKKKYLIVSLCARARIPSQSSILVNIPSIERPQKWYENSCVVLAKRTKVHLRLQLHFPYTLVNADFIKIQKTLKRTTWKALRSWPFYLPRNWFEQRLS